MQKRVGMSRKSRIGTGRPSGLKLLGTGSLGTRTSHNQQQCIIVHNCIYSLFADWRKIALPEASFSEEEVKEVKGLVVSSYTSLQFLELELFSSVNFISLTKQTYND